MPVTFRFPKLVPGPACILNLLPACGLGSFATYRRDIIKDSYYTDYDTQIERGEEREVNSHTSLYLRLSRPVFPGKSPPRWNISARDTVIIQAELGL